MIEAALLEPSRVQGLAPAQWDLLVRQGRTSNLLARLADLLAQRGLLDGVPEAPRRHLQSAQRIAERQRLVTRWEVECIRRALAGATRQLTLLKGAAYVMAELPHASSRLFTDVDILVPRADLDAVESALLLNGWRGEAMSAYDHRFYRLWMHELPPMHHVRRGNSIDVHHTILPATARIRINTAALFEGLTALPALPDVHVLRPAEMLLHSATHLFHEGEFDNGLRDLFDLDALLRHHGSDAGFWPALIERAVALGLRRPLFYALRYSAAFLGTPVPAEVQDAAAAGAPGRAVLALMDFCYGRALQPAHGSCNSAEVRCARLLLYLRSHWIRLPTHLLVYHLGRKLVLRLLPEKDDPTQLPGAPGAPDAPH
jgi:hypothetical protein